MLYARALLVHLQQEHSTLLFKLLPHLICSCAFAAKPRAVPPFLPVCCFWPLADHMALSALLSSTEWRPSTFTPTHSSAQFSPLQFISSVLLPLTHIVCMLLFYSRLFHSQLCSSPLTAGRRSLAFTPSVTPTRSSAHLHPL